MVEIETSNAEFADLKVGASTYVLAATFKAIAFPPGMPDYQQAAIMDRVAQAKDAAGDSVIDNRMSADHAAEEQRKEEAQGTDNLSLWIQIAQQERAEREHERIWAETSHSYAGQTLTGEQWKQMADWFSNDENVAQWEDAMMAETGQSRAEVRQTGGKMKRFYDLMGKDAKGTLTTDERREFDTLGKDKEVRRGVEVQQEIQGLQQAMTHDLTDANEKALDGSHAEKIKSFASTLADESGAQLQTTQPALSPTYRAAALGNTTPAPQPALAPSQTITVSPDNMFG